MTDDLYTEEERFHMIYQLLLLSGKYKGKNIEEQVHEIMNNPHLYPEYFQ